MRASCLAFCNECCKEGSLEQESLRDKQVGSKRPATASGCGGAGPSAASALLSDAPRHRPRRASLHPAPRRSQRRLTPFFSSLLVFSQRDELLQAILAEVQAEPDQDPEHDVEVNRIPHAPVGADRATDV